MMKTFNDQLPMYLQFFAEEGDSQEDTPQDNESGQEEETSEEESSEEEEKAFSKSELDAIVAREKSKALKQAQSDKELRAQIRKEVESEYKQSKAYENMTKAEKLQHDLEEAQKENERLKQENQLSEMREKASTTLSDSNLPVDDGVLDLVTRLEAEEQKVAVQSLIAFASKIKKNNARQKTPSDGSKFSGNADSKKSRKERAEEKRKSFYNK